MQIEAEAPATGPLSLRGVTRRYRAVTALEGIDLELRPHEVMAVVGPSGCGKSTLLELVAGLQEPDEGAVRVLGRAEPARRRAVCAYMPQRDLLLPWRDALGNAALVRSTEAYDALLLAPTTGYDDTEALAIVAGDVVVIRALSAACAGRINQFIYSKLVIDSVNVANRTIHFRMRVNPNCGFRSFAPGVPTE